jgi:hypothetical protein
MQTRERLPCGFARISEEAVTSMEAGGHDSLTDQLMELHSLQEARVAAEEEARLRAAEDARRREEAAARKRREEEEARLRAEQETRMAEEHARREEEERRFRAGREAELRVRLEEEAKARAAEQQRLLAHDKEIAAITAVEKNKIRMRRMALGGAAFILIAALGSYVFVVQPALERRALETELAVQAQRQAAMDKERAEADLVTEKERTQQAELEKQRLEERLEKRAQAKQKAAQAASSSRPKQARQPKKQGCAPDDPLCGIPLD